ncbi:hypothetical protein PFISCL1PPCAC_7622, partial [Pristionchus fissidentatus]
SLRSLSSSSQDTILIEGRPPIPERFTVVEIHEEPGPKLKEPEKETTPIPQKTANEKEEKTYADAESVGYERSLSPPATPPIEEEEEEE